MILRVHTSLITLLLLETPFLPEARESFLVFTADFIGHPEGMNEGLGGGEVKLEEPHLVLNW